MNGGSLTHSSSATVEALEKWEILILSSGVFYIFLIYSDLMSLLPASRIESDKKKMLNT